MRKRFIWEAEGDEGGESSGNDNASTDAKANTSSDNASDDNTDDAGDDNKDEGEEDEEPSDDDFSIDTSDGSEDENSDDSGDSGDSGIDSGSSGGSSEEPTPEDDAQNDQSKEKDILAKEKEIFATLSPAEQRAKNRELKLLFKKLYDSCNYIMDKINDLGSDIQTATPQLKRTVTIIFQIKQSVYDYLFNLYDTKGYIENKQVYYTNLMMLNQVKKVLIKINDAYAKDVKSEE